MVVDARVPPDHHAATRRSRHNSKTQSHYSHNHRGCVEDQATPSSHIPTALYPHEVRHDHANRCHPHHNMSMHGGHHNTRNIRWMSDARVNNAGASAYTSNGAPPTPTSTTRSRVPACITIATRRRNVLPGYVHMTICHPPSYTHHSAPAQLGATTHTTTTHNTQELQPRQPYAHGTIPHRHCSSHVHPVHSTTRAPICRME